MEGKNCFGVGDREHMLVLTNICKVFNRDTINEKHMFSHLNLSIQGGEFVTIIGSNGAGKSTLLNIIAGALPADGGRIILDGRDVTTLPEHKRACFMGRVFQDPLLGTSPNMTIEENLSLAFNRAHNTSLGWGLNPKLRGLFCEALAALQLGLEGRLNTKVKFLSGGQRQALTLLMATLTKPKLLLLDEHSAALDPNTAVQINDLSERIIAEYGITTLMVTHNMENAIKMGNRLIMLQEGKIILDIRGLQKARLSVGRLLEMFREVQGSEFSYDEALLAP